jgi:hypothetical protein
MTTLTIANMNDASMAAVSARGLKGAEAAGLKAILTAAVFLKVRGDNKATQGVLFAAFKDVTTEGSANNYLSKSRAAAIGDHFKWAVDVNGTLEDVVEAILPEFRTYWGAVNSIKRSGPGKAEGKARASKAAEEPAEGKGPTLVEATPLMLAAAVKSRLGEMLADGSRAIDTATLVALRDAIDTEIAARAAEASEIKQAA